MKYRQLTFNFLGILLCLSGAQSLYAQELRAPFLLLGEVHDNSKGHQQRILDLQALLDQGWRPALVMEQFDADRSLDLSFAQQECKSAKCVIQKAGNPHWDWSHYTMLIELAMKYDLPIIAANLSNRDANKIVREGVTAVMSPEIISRFQIASGMPTELLLYQVKEVEVGHCGLLPKYLLPKMAEAQLARDIQMAQAMIDARASGRDVVLIAGNGHVRNDIGVPYWLRQQGLRDIQSVAYLEPTTQLDANAYTQIRNIPLVNRSDPCAGVIPVLKQPINSTQ